MTAASWVLQRLPGEVVEHQRGDLIQTLAKAGDLTVEIRIGSPALVRIKDGARLLVEIPAKRPCSRSPRSPLRQVRSLRP